MPKLDPLALDGVFLFTPDRHGDARGWFSESWRRDIWQEAGVTTDFVQDNESFSQESGTVRGLHFQLAPMAQAKLVRVLAGRILDVAVDIRPGSKTFGKHVEVELGADDRKQLFIPTGFAHGFCTLQPNTQIAYKVSAYYSPAHDRGIRWNDPALGIAWPVRADQAILSDKDQKLPDLKSII